MSFMFWLNRTTTPSVLLLYLWISVYDTELGFSVACYNVFYREKPGDEDFVKLDQMKIPFLLNFAQCQLLLDDFYPAIEHTTEVLKRDPGSWFGISLFFFFVILLFFSTLCSTTQPWIWLVCISNLSTKILELIAC